MKGLGTGIKEFKKGVKEEDSLEEPKERLIFTVFLTT